MARYSIPNECFDGLGEEDAYRFIDWLFRGDWVVTSPDPDIDIDTVHVDPIGTRKEWDLRGRPHVLRRHRSLATLKRRFPKPPHGS